MDSTQNIISFCTGYGGIELGLKLAGIDFRTIAYVEIEAFAAANLVAKIEQGKMDAAPIWTDIKTFDGKPFRGKVHGIIGGYPCQPFSNAGQRKGTDDTRHLWPYILEHIRTIRPVWCFFENVSGHLTLGFDEVFKSLRDLGYKVEAGLFTAAEVGAPHKRERLFILAYAGHLPGCTKFRQQQKECSKEFPRSDKLANTESKRPLRESRSIQQENGRSRGTLLRQPIGTDTELGNPNSQQGRPHSVGRDDKAETRSAGEKLADTKNQRIQRDGAKGQQESEIHAGQEIPMCDCRGARWPARPGQPQYEWEEPRTVKSGMGRTVARTPEELDAIANRVDRLRLLGNGVVAQTAKLAWRILWQKIDTNNEK